MTLAGVEVGFDGGATHRISRLRGVDGMNIPSYHIFLSWRSRYAVANPENNNPLRRSHGLFM